MDIRLLHIVIARGGGGGDLTVYKLDCMWEEEGGIWSK